MPIIVDMIAPVTPVRPGELISPREPDPATEELVEEPVPAEPATEAAGPLSGV